jgi:hypothetical protein
MHPGRNGSTNQLGSLSTRPHHLTGWRSAFTLSSELLVRVEFLTHHRFHPAHAPKRTSADRVPDRTALSRCGVIDVKATASSGDVKKLLDAGDPDLRAFVGLCAFVGLHSGEVAGVPLGDIDFLRRTPSVGRQVQRCPGGFEIRAPNYGSERQV